MLLPDGDPSFPPIAPPAATGATNWDDSFQVANCLYAFRNMLQLQVPVGVDSLIATVATVTAAAYGIGLAVNGQQVDGVDGGKDGSGAVANGAATVAGDANGSAIATATATAAASADHSDNGDAMDVEQSSSSSSSSSSSCDAMQTDEGNGLTVADDNSGTADATDESNGSAHAATNGSAAEPAAESATAIAVKADPDPDTNPTDPADPTNSTITDPAPTHPDPAARLDAALAHLDRVQLCLANAVTADLHALLDLGPKDAAPAVRLPLNQLTFAEVSRMVLLASVLSEQGRDAEDIQHALRGSRLPTSYRLSKNVARYIRYRLAVRARVGVSAGALSSGSASGSARGSGDGSGGGVTTGTGAGLETGAAEDEEDVEDRLCQRASGGHLSILPSTHPTPHPAHPTPHPAHPAHPESDEAEGPVFGSESEIVAALLEASASPKYAECYQRCCKVRCTV